MATSEPHPRGSKIDALVDFAFQPEAEVDAMSKEELSEFLKARGLDPGSRMGELRQMLAQIDGKRRLAAAKEDRERRAVRNKRPLPQIGDMKAELLRRIGELQLRDPGRAAVYARNFEGLSDDDVTAMLRDLIDLEGEDDAGAGER